jgi:hypothetical protein
MEMNSATPARKVSGWESSPGEPMAILLTGIFDLLSWGLCLDRLL